MKDFSVEILKHSFPKKYQKDAIVVAHSLPKEICIDGSFCKYKLLNGENIEFPYRIYEIDRIKTPSEFTFIQKIIFHAFLSRSDNGYIREIHIHELLDMNYPEWVFPYIIKLSDEYVVERFYNFQP